jgi:hypothetical protein
MLQENSYWTKKDSDMVELGGTVAWKPGFLCGMCNQCHFFAWHALHGSFGVMHGHESLPKDALMILAAQPMA